MSVVPELGGDEEGFAVYSGSFDGFCNGRFGAVDVCCVNVLVLYFLKKIRTSACSGRIKGW